MGGHTGALIGCGTIGPSHLKAFADSGVRLAAVCDKVIRRAQEGAAAYRDIAGNGAAVAGGAACYCDYRKMLDEVKPGIVAVATESGSHAEITVECLNAGAHVICEKPMALSTADADAMIAAAKKTGKKLTVCFQNRFNAPVKRLRAAAGQGRFGRLLHGAVQVRWHRGPSYYRRDSWRGTWEHDGGTLMNQCIHGIDLLQWIMGEDAVRVQAVTRRFTRPIEAEDFGAAVVEFAGGAVGIIEGTACVYPGDLGQTLSIFGEKGTAVVGGLAVSRLETWHLADEEAAGKTCEPEPADSSGVYGNGHSELFADFVSAIDNNREPLTSGLGGKKALEIVLAIYMSQKLGRAVDIPCNFSTADMQGYFGSGTEC